LRSHLLRGKSFPDPKQQPANLISPSALVDDKNFNFLAFIQFAGVVNLRACFHKAGWPRMKLEPVFRQC
jgi:hypothetical protein